MTLAIVSVLVGMGAPLLAGLLDAYLTARAMLPATSEGHLAMERMIRELGQAKFSSVSCPYEQDSITFLSEYSHKQTTFYPFPGGGFGIYMDQGALVQKTLAQHVRAGSLRFAVGDCGPLARLVRISFIVRDQLPDGTEITWPLRSAIHVVGP